MKIRPCAGSKGRDIIVYSGQSPIAGIDNVHRLLSKDAIGRKLDIVLLREGSTLEVSIVATESPD